MEPSTNLEVCDMGDQCLIEENGLCSTFFTPTPFSSSPSIYGPLGAHQGIPSRFPHPPSQLIITQNSGLGAEGPLLDLYFASCELPFYGVYIPHMCLGA